LIKRLEEQAPEILQVQIPEALFDAAVEGLLKEPPISDEIRHFFCRPCGEYHLKTHPHHAEMKTRKLQKNT